MSSRAYKTFDTITQLPLVELLVLSEIERSAHGKIARCARQ